MTEDDIRQMIADRAEGTKGDWYVFEPEDYEGPGTLPSLGVEADGGEAVVWYATDAEEGIANDFDARRIARVPELEAEVLRLREALEQKEAERLKLRDALKEAVGHVMSLLAKHGMSAGAQEALREQLMNEPGE